MMRLVMAALVTTALGCGDEPVQTSSNYCERLRFGPCDEGAEAGGMAEGTGGVGGMAGAGGSA